MLQWERSLGKCLQKHDMDYAPFTLCKMLSNIYMNRRVKRKMKKRKKRRKERRMKRRKYRRMKKHVFCQILVRACLSTKTLPILNRSLTLGGKTWASKQLSAVAGCLIELEYYVAMLLKFLIWWISSHNGISCVKAMAKRSTDWNCTRQHGKKYNRKSKYGCHSWISKYAPQISNFGTSSSQLSRMHLVTRQHTWHPW